MEKMADLLEAHSLQDNAWSFMATRRIPCVGHVINLAVQEIIKNGFSSEAPEDIMDVDNDLCDTTTLAKLRKGILKIRTSPQRSATFERKRIAMECPSLKLTLDVRRRWNSTYEMLNRALKLKEAYMAMTANGDLKDFALEGDEWDRVEHMCKLLEPFDHATRMLSASTSHTTVNMTILSYNRLIDKLEDFDDTVENPTCPQDLRDAAKAGREKLLPYYGRTDDTEEKSIKDKAEKSVCDTWSKFSGMVPVAPEISEQSQALHELFLLEPTNDELKEYVAERSLPPMVTKDKPQELLFWESAATRWPSSSRMAARYLAIPATSTPSKRCFSATRLMLPHTRNRLAPDTIKQLMLLGSWQSFFDGINEREHDE
ncbi:hypothetical protein O0I10_012978 [Lichtheimia ornata]|uniref:HAT C-terminal dimerisation domain-containing protein n=1 Tax=Lichtheimia ornata TaxID=688661 RepID=A0AAD7UQU3_9FUNG|nr:uncharacterized protein O0I10_012978 [Lichtheimia ornata]KAJ8651460.1 hypothetical protein O0I10_012978 [Lichtheimia ornata]